MERHLQSVTHHAASSLPLEPKAKAPQPAIKQSPPIGVTGPSALNFWGSSVKR